MIPTINITAWLSPNSTSQSRDAVVNEIRSACRVYGFFQLEGHGIPLEMQNEVLKCAECFFSLPIDQKQEISITKSIGSANRGYEDFQGQRLESKALPDLKEVRQSPT
jgi:isopenicillin N synthase-like dioxygenase